MQPGTMAAGSRLRRRHCPGSQRSEEGEQCLETVQGREANRESVPDSDGS